jgi:hypothetical protein
MFKNLELSAYERNMYKNLIPIKMRLGIANRVNIAGILMKIIKSSKALRNMRIVIPNPSSLSKSDPHYK